MYCSQNRQVVWVMLGNMWALGTSISSYTTQIRSKESDMRYKLICGLITTEIVFEKLVTLSNYTLNYITQYYISFFYFHRSQLLKTIIVKFVMLGWHQQVTKCSTILVKTTRKIWEIQGMLKKKQNCMLFYLYTKYF